VKAEQLKSSLREKVQKITAQAPDRKILTTEIIRNLQAALAQFAEIPRQKENYAHL
jgi:hypothetical protein